jgi:undecaprenyl-diphosphatase
MIAIPWLAGLVFLLTKGYTQSFLILNSYHSAWLDYPMLILTMLGDAGFLAFLLIFLLIKKQPYQLTMLLMAIILSGIIAQLFKNFVFSNWVRPPFLFKEQIHTVAHYLLYHRSFPSGHSTTVAAVFTLLAYFRKNYKSEVILYAFLCTLIAYTRVYLGVHFLGDALAGILLGICCSAILLILIRPFTLKLKPWLITLLRIVSVVAACFILVEFFMKYL